MSPLEESLHHPSRSGVEQTRGSASFVKSRHTGGREVFDLIGVSDSAGRRRDGWGRGGERVMHPHLLI